MTYILSRRCSEHSRLHGTLSFFLTMPASLVSYIYPYPTPQGLQRESRGAKLRSCTRGSMIRLYWPVLVLFSLN